MTSEQFDQLSGSFNCGILYRHVTGMHALPAKLLSPFSPRGPKYKILIETQNHDWPLIDAHDSIGMPLVNNVFCSKVERSQCSIGNKENKNMTSNKDRNCQMYPIYRP